MGLWVICDSICQNKIISYDELHIECTTNNDGLLWCQWMMEQKVTSYIWDIDRREFMEHVKVAIGFAEY